MISANQAYGGGTMIGQYPAQILATCPARKEGYVTAVLNLQRVRDARQHSRNLQQRRPELYGEIVYPVDKSSRPTDRAK